MEGIITPQKGWGLGSTGLLGQEPGVHPAELVSRGTPSNPGPGKGRQAGGGGGAV